MGAAKDARWLEEARKKNISLLAIHTPAWMGVSSSTRNLFEHLFPVPASRALSPRSVTPAQLDHLAALLLKSGIERFVCSGGDEIHFQLVRRIKEKKPSVRADFLWHGNFMQMGDAEVRRLMKLWIDGARAGIITTLGTVKKGMEELFASYGVRSRFVMNFVRDIPVVASTPAAGGPHLGLWFSGEKPPYAMLAAARLIKGSVVHGANISSRGREAMEFLELPAGQIAGHSLPQAQMFEAIRKTHLSLYVTFSECAPMLPLESLGLGVPCLIGPNNHYFEDDDFLRERLCVPYPDRADVIAKMARRAIAERTEIIERYKSYAPGYIERAKAGVRDFLGDN